MQTLNTEPRLYEAVDALLQEPRLRTSLSAEQLRFAQSMAAEFQHDGVHLSAERRQQLCALHAEATLTLTLTLILTLTLTLTLTL